MTQQNQDDIEHKKINNETAKISWEELQPHFASGSTVYVDSKLDLVDVALKFSQNDSASVESLMNQGMLSLVSDKQASIWLEENSMFWSVVVKPWVLVQLVE